MRLKKYGNTERIAIELATAPALELGLLLWDVRFEKEGAEWYLRIFFDRADGKSVNISDCEALSRPVNKLLDETDPIEQRYFFEVGSAGNPRELLREEHFTAYLNKTVRLVFIRPVDGAKELDGSLCEFDRETLTLLVGAEKKTFPFSGIAHVRTIYDPSQDEAQS